MARQAGVPLGLTAQLSREVAADSHWAEYIEPVRTRADEALAELERRGPEAG
jgi:hypothetical protein